MPTVNDPVLRALIRSFRDEGLSPEQQQQVASLGMTINQFAVYAAMADLEGAEEV